MEWDDLKHFLAVARAGSLADAARSLKTSSPTVGRRIAALETRLGVRLFDRNRTGYALTESGEAIRARAEEVEDAVFRVERQVLGRDRRPAGKVRLATVNEIAAHLVAPQLGEFRRCYPEIVLEVVVGLDLANLTRREADVALRTVRPERGNLTIRHAGWWRSGLYAAKSYAKAHGLKPGLSDFANLDVITWTEECSHLPGGPWFAEHARGSNVALEANSRHIHYSACKAGLGLAILPCLAADRDPALVRLLPPEQVFTADLYILVHKELTSTARVRAVIDFLCERITKYTR
jgi:DNA-binding transcriptional LysR family regulator